VCAIFLPWTSFFFADNVTKYIPFSRVINISPDFFIIKPTRCTNFTNLFWHETLHVSDSSSVYHQELFTVHSAMVYVIQVCRQLLRRTRMELQFHPRPARRLSTNLYDVHHC
jgi:hypothetical protein